MIDSNNPWGFSEATARVIIHLEDGLCANYSEDVENCIAAAYAYLDWCYPEDYSEFLN